MPSLLGIYVFTTGRLDCRRLVFLPTRLDDHTTVVGRLQLHQPAASFAADWCFRLHGWPIMPPLLGVYVFTDRPPRRSAADWCLRLHGSMVTPPLLGVYVFTDRLPRLLPTSVFACTAGLLCRRC
ncbi:Os08g0223866 [Oryza sativa Japonica Group]|uniref:cysteine dioxygenase n=1 Tax=Oryza sativa subsp. japonica TaxID=39947 RepID=A0A0N7KPG8_ORYSJ|nr:Os08g0223866 [Oryza sativa Japonica Group]